MSDQLIIVKLYVTTESAKELLISILLRAFNSILKINLTNESILSKFFLS